MVGQSNDSVKQHHERDELDDYDADRKNKRRKSSDERDPFYLVTKDTVYRYLCPASKIGRIIGRGGEIVRQLRSSSEARILIGDSISGCEDRVVTICSSNEDSEGSEDTSDYVCPAQHALFLVHEKLFERDAPDDEDIDVDPLEVSVRLLVPSDQIGHIIGKSGQTIHSLRNDSEALIRVVKSDLPLCANSSDELIQITGEAPAIKKALFQVSCLLHRNPSSLYNLQEETVFRYLCEEKSVGGIIGKGGEIVKQLRADSLAKITVGDKVPGCKERLVTIFSSCEKTNIYRDLEEYVCPAQDALFRLHEKLARSDPPCDEDLDMESRDSVRLLVPSDQIGHIIGKGGHIVHDIRSNTGANIRILKGERLPPCANNEDELLQITGQAPSVMKALIQVSSYLRDKPSRSQCLLSPYDQHMRRHQGSTGASERDKSSRVVLRLVCPSNIVARVIGKNGSIINSIRQQSGASIEVDSSTAEDCMISISGKESFEDPVSPAVYAAVKLQPKCSEITERKFGDPLYITRLLVPASQIGCLIGKGGSIINGLRRATQANIRIMPKENLPRVASENDVLVQISGELDAARDALIQMSTLLKENALGKGGGHPYRS